MAKVQFRVLELKKRFPLAISRGTMAGSENLFVTISDGEFVGLGELSPATGSQWTAERGQAQLEKFAASAPLENPFDTYAAMREAKIDPPAMAALDVALWDLLAKRAQMPLFALLGLPRRSVPTSVTIGLNPPEVTRERVPEIIRRTGAKCLKIKLGSPAGLDHDRDHFAAAAEAAAPFHMKLRVDANGGWEPESAGAMIRWLWERGVEYVEQPLAEGREADLPSIFRFRRLPIFADESIRTSEDVPALADRVDGVNLKLMKCGGITEALRIVATARAYRLQTMIGCMSESSVAIAAGAAIGALFDHIDLDSHLNLDPDPAEGAEIVDGVITPTDRPGHGAMLPAMLDPSAPLAVYMEGELEGNVGKMGIGILRYSPNPVVCMIDSATAGRDAAEVTGVPRPCPIVGTVEAAIELGATVLVLGIAPPGGLIPPSWYPVLDAAWNAGLSLVNGLHDLLGPRYSATAKPGQWVWDIRVEPPNLGVGGGRAADMPNRRILMIGTDMAVGKMTAGLEIYRAARERGIRADFVATGQIGITISGRGVPLDAVRVDYASGAVEAEVVKSAADLVVVEGQGSLIHPGSTANLPLLRGTCPTHLILCARAGQTHLARLPEIAIPPLGDLIRLYEELSEACGTFPRPHTPAICLNTFHLSDGEARRAIDDLEQEVGLPVVDPIRDGCGTVLASLGF